MNKFLWFFILTFTIAFNAYGKGDIASKVASGELFSKQYTSIEEFSSEEYYWITHGVSIRFPSPTFTLGSLQLGETICYFDNQKPVKLIVSIYNRGDKGQITDEAFVGKLRATANALNSIFKIEGVTANRKSDPTRSTFDIGGMLWNTPTTQALMEYSVKNQGARTVPTAEYIRLTIIPTPKASGSKSIRDLERKKRPRDYVTSLPDGGRVISGVPMVDQGQKGYCAAATTARVMGYYGYEQLDQHQIAQWAKTDAESGTSMDEMMDGIKRVLHDTYKLNIVEIERFDIRDFIKLVERYNKEAEKKDVLPIVLPDSGVINVGNIYSCFNAEILKNVQTKNRQKNDMFFRRIKEQIDKGIPLIWSVQLGLIPEQGLLQASGGHMRLIIGYGGRTANERYIIFSDSWGAGHEQKKMMLDDAITITTGLLAITPRLN